MLKKKQLRKKLIMVQFECTTKELYWDNTTSTNLRVGVKSSHQMINGQGEK